MFLKGNTLYAVSSKGTKKWDLTAGRPDITNLISEIDRKKEEILRLNNPDNYNDITSLEKPGYKPAKISYNYYDTKASTYKCYELNFFISENELSDLNSIH